MSERVDRAVKAAVAALKAGTDAYPTPWVDTEFGFDDVRLDGNFDLIKVVEAILEAGDEAAT